MNGHNGGRYNVLESGQHGQFARAIRFFESNVKSLILFIDDTLEILLNIIMPPSFESHQPPMT